MHPRTQPARLTGGPPRVVLLLLRRVGPLGCVVVVAVVVWTWVGGGGVMGWGVRGQTFAAHSQPTSEEEKGGEE